MTIPSKYKLPNDFTTESAYINYFDSLSFDSRLEIANSNLPIAQRLMAERYDKQNDFANGAIFWGKAENNMDAFAILRKTIIWLKKNDLDNSRITYDLARKLCDNYPDIEGRLFLEEKLQTVRINLFVNMYDRGEEKFSNNDVTGARADWTSCMTLGDPNGTYKLAFTYFLDEDYAKAKYLFKLALYFTNDLTFFNLDSGITSKVKGEIHLCLAAIKKHELDNVLDENAATEKNTSQQDSFVKKSTRKTLSHLNKATAYGIKGDKENDNETIKTELLDRIDPNERKQLIEETIPIKINTNFTVKTKYEIENTTFSNKNELLTMFSYRKPKEKAYAGISIENIEKNFTKRNMG